jgi:hypothetical protein
LKLAIEGHGGARRWEQIERFRVAEPWHEDGQTWRTLLVTYPDTIVAHHRQQTCYFDDAGLLRRLDYSVDILGGGPAVHYPSAYRELDGIMVPPAAGSTSATPTAPRFEIPSPSPSTSPTSPSAKSRPICGRSGRGPFGMIEILFTERAVVSAAVPGGRAPPMECLVSYDGGPSGPSCTSAACRSRREPIPSLVYILRRCHSTVRADRNSWAPISGLVRPSRASRAM